MNNIIINADDFGSGASVNKAIVDLFEKNLINSTTLMANMPGFEEAIDLAHSHKIVSKIGAHLVLTGGMPLTTEIKNIPYLFNSDAKPRKYLFKELFFLNNEKKRLIFNEYCSQIERIKESGIQITHLDTHHHLHEMWGVLEILLELLKKYHIPKVRIYDNLKINDFHKNVYRLIMNRYLKLKKVNNSDYFCDRISFLSVLAKDAQFATVNKIEIMVHPDYNANGEVVDLLRKNEFDFKYIEEFNLLNINK